MVPQCGVAKAFLQIALSLIDYFIQSPFSFKSCCLYDQVAEVELVSPLSLKRCIFALELGTLNYAH